MYNIAKFLSRLIDKRSKDVVFRMIVKELLKEKVNIDVRIEDISVKASIVRIKNISPVVLSAIFIKKQNIIEKLNSVQGEIKVIDLQ